MANKSPKPIESNTGKKYKRTMFDPRIDMFKQFYMSPTSPTFMNIRRSALRAGYTDQYARNISVQKPSWWIELIENTEYLRAQSLKQAENNLYETVCEPLSNDVQEKKLQLDTSKFVTERLGKEVYSARTELTGAGGRRLIPDETRASTKIPLTSLFKGVDESQKA